MNKLVLRAQGYLLSREHLARFIASGRPAFIMCSLTMEPFPRDDGTYGHSIYVKEYDVSLWRKKRIRNNGFYEQVPGQ